MKIVEILNEAKPVNVDIDGVVSQVKRNCQQFLSQVEVPMWRGLSFTENQSPIFGKIETQEYRKPRDTPPIINTYMMAWLLKEFNVPFRQKTTMFATGSKPAAYGFGTPFMVFPIGEFDYCWSPRIKDLTDEFHCMTGQQLSADEIKQNVFSVMSAGDYKLNTGLNSGLNSYKEVMVYCKSYYIFNALAYLHSIRSSMHENELFQELFK